MQAKRSLEQLFHRMRRQGGYTPSWGGPLFPTRLLLTFIASPRAKVVLAQRESTKSASSAAPASQGGSRLCRFIKGQRLRGNCYRGPPVSSLNLQGAKGVCFRTVMISFVPWLPAHARA